MRSGYDRWQCPFCGAQATEETDAQVLCDSRTCACGAVALAAPVIDTDEIVDDALGMYGVEIRDESRGFDALLLEDLRRAGVEIRDGERTELGEGSWRHYRALWFRRCDVSPSA